jgi:hypothetical protein
VKSENEGSPNALSTIELLGVSIAIMQKNY